MHYIIISYIVNYKTIHLHALHYPNRNGAVYFDFRQAFDPITCVSKPTTNSIEKKRADHTALPGSIARASGYTTKTKPGPI